MNMHIRRDGSGSDQMTEHEKKVEAAKQKRKEKNIADLDFAGRERTRQRMRPTTLFQLNSIRKSAGLPPVEEGWEDD